MTGFRASGRQAKLLHRRANVVKVRTPMRHIISILLQNEAGALARVAGTFSSRGYNIDSLSVAPTHDPTVSRLSLVTSGSDAVIDQIIKQTRKLIDVVEIVNLSSSDHLECELLMVKLAVDAKGTAALAEAVSRHQAKIIDETGGAHVVQLAGSGARIDAFLAEVDQHATVLELARSGVAAMSRGREVLALPA